MGNMSYCRFQNTELDLRDCYYSMVEDDGDELSDDEQKAKKRLMELCEKIIDEFGEEE
jgi:hypothetical protein